jgi:hypothetical protein
MNTRYLTLLCLLGAGCMVPGGGSPIVATKVIRATSSGTGCVYDAGTPEVTFGFFDAATGYMHALVLENRLLDNALKGPGRVNTNDFQVEYATIDYEIVSGPAQTLPQQTTPANALIPTNAKGSTGLTLVPPGFIVAGTVVRLHIQVHGRLLDGTRVKTTTYEYVVAATTGQTQPTSCTGTQVAVYCENNGLQDTGFVCQ